MPTQRTLLAVFLAFLAMAVALSLFYIPTHSTRGTAGVETGVVLELERSSYAPNDTIRAVLENKLNQSIYIGVDYRVERLVNGEWVLATDQMPDAFVLPLLILSSGKNWTFTIQLHEAPPGHYRIAKEVWLDDLGHTRLWVFAEFDVQG